MSKLVIEHRGDVTLFRLNRPAVHNNVDDELATSLFAMGRRSAQRPSPACVVSQREAAPPHRVP